MSNYNSCVYGAKRILLVVIFILFSINLYAQADASGNTRPYVIPIDVYVGDVATFILPL